jgi:GTP-binding protein of the ras superfamily involved in termination of M-phase
VCGCLRQVGGDTMSFLSSRRSSADALAKADAVPASRQPAFVKVALLGDSQVGKTSLMVRYVETTFDETQLQTQGVNFMEKSVSLEEQAVRFSIWDIGGHTDSESMLPLVCNDAAALLLVFDLTRPETLESIREWHRKARTLNKCAIPLLVGCKYDSLLAAPVDEHMHMCTVAMRFASAIDAPLVFCAPSVPINVTNVFKVLLIRLFGLAPAVPLFRSPGEPLIIYEQRDLSDEIGTTTAAMAPAAAAPANVLSRPEPAR